MNLITKMQHIWKATAVWEIHGKC